MTTLPYITKKQQELLILIYRYRFINRTQLQYFLNHKNPAKINIWLKDLVTKNYIKSVVTTKLEKIHTPAIYYLSLNGIRFLKQHDLISVSTSRKYYAEANRSPILKSHCLAVADFACNLLAHARSQQKQITFLTKADYAEDTDDTLLLFLHVLRPDAYYSYEGTGVAQTAFIEVIDEHVPLRVVARRLRSYPDSYDSPEWKNIDKDKFPSVVVLVPTMKKLLSVQRMLQRSTSTDQDALRYNLALISDIQAKSLTENIWFTV
jgi:hypothetical protein